MIFDDWQLLESFKTKLKLLNDMKIDKNAQERESWAGIEAMNLSNLNSNSAIFRHISEKRKSEQDFPKSKRETLIK